MTLLITVFAALICTVLWYVNAAKDKNYCLGTLCFMYWGASIMWSVDFVIEYLEEGAAVFNPAPLEMLNDSFLGLWVVAIGLIIWLVVLLVKDPQGAVRKTLSKKNK